MERPWLRRRKNLSRQEMFDIVWNHFVVEKHPRNVSMINSFRTPVYGGGTGYCAAGLFLTDKECAKADKCALDGNGGYNIINITGKLGLKLDTEFLFSLQECHDSYPTTKQIEEALRRVAVYYTLKVPGDV